MEEVTELRRSDRMTHLMYRVIAWASGLTILVTIAYGAVSTLLTSGGVIDIGLTLVNVEFPFPPYVAKPVTYLSVASVAFFYSSLRLWENRIARWSRVRLSTLQLFAIIIAFASAYEVMYNFMLWGALYSAQVITSSLNSVNLNIISTPKVLSTIPWNLVFATRMFSSLFVIAGYSAFFLRRLHSREENQSKTDMLG
jgi:hypothetical protein